MGVGGDGEVVESGWRGSRDGTEWVPETEDVDTSHWNDGRGTGIDADTYSSSEASGSVDGYDFDAAVECDGGEGD